MKTRRLKPFLFVIALYLIPIGMVSTALTTPSAFDRINVRRLFITLEKAIANASKFQLFEFNDEFTRANFRNIVEPFLREVQGRRGITDFLVVCDETNNTGEVIDRIKFDNTN